MLKKILHYFKKREEESKRKRIIRVIVPIVVIVIILIAILLVVFFPRNNASAAKLRVTIVTEKDCATCWDVNLLIDALKTHNVKISTTTIYHDSGKGKSLVKKYNIDKIPTVLIEGELDKDPNLKPFWEQLGEMNGKVFVFRQVIPPYFDLASGQMKGNILVTFLTDETCTTCYDVSLHGNALKNLAIPTENYKFVDMASKEGKDLISKYSIKKVPTMLISGEVNLYNSLTQLWSQVGIIAEDGTYVFSEVDLMGTYKDLVKNKVVVPEPAPQTQE